MDPTQFQAIAKQLSPEKIMEVGLSCFSSKVLLTAVELRVFTILSKQQMTGEELGKLLSLHPRGIYDFLDALVALGFLRREGTGAAGRYSNSPESALFLDRSEPTYRGGILERVNARLYGFWNDLGTALKTGVPQNELKRKATFRNAVFRPGTARAVHGRQARYLRPERSGAGRKVRFLQIPDIVRRGGGASAGPPPRSITARTVPAAFCWKLQWTCQLPCLSQVSSVIGCTRAQPQLASDI